MVKHRKLIIAVLGVGCLLALLWFGWNLLSSKPEKENSYPEVHREDIEKDLAEGRLLTHTPSRWPKAIALVGDSILEDRDVSVLERQVDHTSRRLPSLAQSGEEWLWEVLVSMPLECKPGTVRRLCRRARKNKDILQAELFLAKHAPKSQVSKTARQVEEAADRLKNGEDVQLRDPLVKSELPYFVLPDDKETLFRLVDLYLEGPIDYFPFVIDACSFISRDRLPADILGTMKEAVLTTELRHKLYGRIVLCYFVAHCRPTGWQDILEEIKKTLPRVIEDGRVVYAVGMHGGGRVLNAAQDVKNLMQFSYPYSRAESRSDKRRFLGKVEDNRNIMPYKAWLIYRHDPEYFQVMFGKYRNWEKIAMFTERLDYRATLLSEVVKLYSLVPVESISSDDVRKFTYNQDSLKKAVNGLFLLKSIVSEEDIGRLLPLARETASVEWDTKEGSTSGPLVAWRAINCLAHIVTPEGRNALQKIVRDEDLPERVREHARKKLNTIEKRLERK